MTAKRLDTALLVASLLALVGLQSLSEYRDALWEVLTYED